jgi:MFS family permease
MPERSASTGVVAGSGIVLLTLASGQFLMALDSSVMNVSIATVASDLGTTVTGIQTAITFYTLVMASLMITGGKIGQLVGRKRAFAIGCIVYGTGSLTTALAPNLLVLLIGWSLLEGIGAALIMPSIVALVATNFAAGDRPRAYGMVAAAGAVAVALGPLIGGLMTTYASWRYVFAGEVVMVLGILLLTRRMADSPPVPGARLDAVGTALSATGLGLLVFGVLRAGSWGVVDPKPGAPVWLGLSPVVWLVLAGGLVLLGFVRWERSRVAAGAPALIDPAMLRIPPLRGGLVAFFFQYLVQAGVFFVVPLFLSVALGLTAVERGRLQPGDRHPERRARHVVQARPRRRSGSTPGRRRARRTRRGAGPGGWRGPLHGDAGPAAPTPVAVEGLERRDAEHALLQVVGEERRLDVVAAEAPRRLGQVVGAEGEELRGLGDLVGGQGARGSSIIVPIGKSSSTPARPRPRRADAASSRTSSSSWTAPTSGIMISGRGSPPAFFRSAAASAIARTCSANSPGMTGRGARPAGRASGSARAGARRPRAAAGRPRCRRRAPRPAPPRTAGR